MNSEFPQLEAKDPNGKTRTYRLHDYLNPEQGKSFISIGRDEQNDIVLNDPEKNISRQHCILEYRSGRWWLSDADSANGTFLNKTDESITDIRFEGTTQLSDGDKILILSKFIEPDDCEFFHLIFHAFSDLSITKDAGGVTPVETDLMYVLSTKQLYWKRFQKKGIHLTRNERKLVHYMAQRTHENSNNPILCGYEELLSAIWKEPLTHSNAEINRLIWSIRKKIENDSGEPKYLKTVPGEGYLLHVKVLP